jgi:AcrR family transcriptional regulator
MSTVSSEKRPYRMQARAEAQERTRRAIAKAAFELHEERGVAATTVADIARRAGVQRLTVYNHFPGLSDLIPACNAHFDAVHPFPDMAPAFAEKDPSERVRVALAAVYAFYRETHEMQRHIHSDRIAVPELDAFLTEQVDAQFRELAAKLATGFKARGKRADRQQALIALALAFWTWQRLDAEGLGDEEAAGLMAASLAAAGS